VEPFIDDYVKFNSNSGWACNTDGWCEVSSMQCGLRKQAVLGWQHLSGRHASTVQSVPAKDVATFARSCPLLDAVGCSVGNIRAAICDAVMHSVLPSQQFAL
jgi:hypothetical protein